MMKVDFKNIFLVADTHFGHERIKEFKRVRRPNDFEERIIKNWNEIVTDRNSLVFYLGDVTLSNSKKEKELIRRIVHELNGRFILVKGNHDKRTNSWYMENGFYFSCDSFVYNKILFTHRPEKEDKKCKYIKINIHGHSHICSKKYAENYNPNNEFNRLLSLEFENYKPISLHKFLRKTDKKKYYKEKLDEHNQRISEIDGK